MAKILAFAGSNSSTSINYQLIKYTAGLIENHDLRLLDLSNYPFAMFNEDLEKKEGYTNSLVELRDEIKNAHGLIISVNEHNGNLSAYFKNVLDWLSRLERQFMDETKLLLLSTSPGGRGAIGALEIAHKLLPRFGAEITASFSLPSFHKNFNENEGIIDSDLSKEYHSALKAFTNSL